MRRVGGVAALALAWACQSAPLIESGDGFRHAERGWSIGAPPGAASRAAAVPSIDGAPPAPGWSRASVPGTLIAYRRPGPLGPIWMTLSSRCQVSLAAPRQMARHLRIGIPDYTVRDSSTVELDGTQGWQQVFDVEHGDTAVRLKTVTAVTGGCALDWVLTVREARDFEAAERDFDAWWQSLRVPEVGS